MITFNDIRQLFVTDNKQVTLPSGDAAWSESTLFADKDFPKYNPDLLIGKKGSAIYRKMMRDEQVKAVTRFKRDAITSRDYFFEVNEDKLSEEEARKRIALSEYIVDKMRGSFIDNVNGIMSAQWQGFSLTEKVYQQVEFEGLTYWGLQSLKLKPFDTFDFYTDPYGNIVKLMQDMDGQKQELNIGKFIHYIHNPEYDEHYGQSELYEAYRAWFSKDMAIKFQNIWMEKHAKGYKVATQTEESSLVKGSSEWNDLVNALSSGGSMILPKGVNVEMHFPANNVAFQQFIDMYDLHIARALLVPNLMGITPAGQTGSYSQSDTQLEAFLWTLDADTARLEEVLNEQLFRQLGEINFNDDYWPRIKFKPVSEKKKLEIIKTWKDLIGSNAVQRSDADEEHLRDMLSFPSKPNNKKDEQAIPTDPGTALNGAQVTSMVDIITKVGLGQLPKESAISLLVAAFPLNREKAENILASIDEGSVKSPQPSPNVPAQGGSADNLNDPDDKQDIKDDGGAKPDDEGGETIAAGSPMYSADVISRASKRVDFKVIERKSVDNEAKYIEPFSKMVKRMGLDITSMLDEAQTLGDVKPKDIKFKASTKQALKGLVSNMLKDGWKIGERSAINELDKANQEEFSAKKINKKRMQFATEDYLSDRAFYVAGKLSDDAQALIENVILQGIKYDKSLEEIKQGIYQTFVSQGLISIEDAEAALSEALVPNPEIDLSGVKNPTARIETMIRTNTFDAINESRYNFYTDPSLEGFVDGLEYSAILDGRTTTICNTYNGYKAPVNDAIWNTIRPPNHFNCRSLLIPITVLDKWSPSKAMDLSDPDNQPNDGFG